MASFARVTAVSFASVPELEKNALAGFIGPICTSFSASWTCGTVEYKVETCTSFFCCSMAAWVTRGWQCPTETVRMPAKKSRYSRPSTSRTNMPFAESTTRASW